MVRLLITVSFSSPALGPWSEIGGSREIDLIADAHIGPVSYYYPQMLAGAGIEDNHTQLLLVSTQ